MALHKETCNGDVVGTCSMPAYWVDKSSVCRVVAILLMDHWRFKPNDLELMGKESVALAAAALGLMRQQIIREWIGAQEEVRRKTLFWVNVSIEYTICE